MNKEEAELEATKILDDFDELVEAEFMKLDSIYETMLSNKETWKNGFIKGFIYASKGVNNK